MQKILVLYGQNNAKNLYDKRVANSNTHIIFHLPIIFDKRGDLICDFKSKKECYDFIKGISKCVIIGDNYFNPIELINTLSKNNINLNIITFCFSVNSDIYVNYMQTKYDETTYNDLDVQTEITKYLIKKPISYFLYNTKTLFEPTLWLSSYINEIPWLENIFRNNDNLFKNSKHRFNINVYRPCSHRMDIISKLLTINNCNFKNKNIITINNVTTNPLTQPQVDYILNETNNWVTHDKWHHVPNKFKLFWLDGYKMFSESKIEIVMETFNVWDDIEKWQRNFTEKLLKPLLANKPCLITDILTFKLFIDWGFEIDETLYGNELIEFFNNIDTTDIGYIKHINSTKVANRLHELDIMEDYDFNEMYKNSLKIAERNKEKIENWKMWYDDIERWFTKN
jgi:hypothetical protein